MQNMNHLPLRAFPRIWTAALATSMVMWGQSAPRTAPSSTTPAPAVTPVYSATSATVKRQPGHIKPLAPTETYHRILCVVPLVGTGTRLDPVRPKYASIHTIGAPYHTGIIAWTQMPADDGKHAIVEMVATSLAAFQAILSDTSSDVVVFQRGKQTKAEMEAGIQKWKKDFTLDSFPRAVAQ